MYGWNMKLSWRLAEICQIVCCREICTPAMLWPERRANSLYMSVRNWVLYSRTYLFSLMFHLPNAKPHFKSVSQQFSISPFRAFKKCDYSLGIKGPSILIFSLSDQHMVFSALQMYACKNAFFAPCRTFCTIRQNIVACTFVHISA